MENDALLVPVKIACWVVNEETIKSDQDLNIRRFQYQYANLEKFYSPEPQTFSSAGTTDLGVYIKWELPAGLRHGISNDNEYVFALMSELQSKPQLEQGKLYINVERGIIKYKVLDYSNLEQSGEITAKDMPSNAAFPISNDLEQFSQIKKNILEVTSTRGHTLNNNYNIDFPQVPTRWLAIRCYDDKENKQCKAWIIESNYQDPNNKEGSYFLDLKKKTLLGRCVELDKWMELNKQTPDKSSYVNKLTAIDNGDPAFSIYQPYGKNVFSFYDNLDKIDKAKLSYFVCGWYDNVDQDPLKQLLDTFKKQNKTSNLKDMQKSFKERYFWEFKDIVEAEIDSLQGTIFHGFSSAVNWDRNGTNSAQQKDDNKFQIAIGSSTLDALAALLKYSECGIPPLLLDAFKHGLLDKLEDIDLEEELQQQCHQDSFVDSDGGLLWEIVNESQQQSLTTNEMTDISLELEQAIGKLNDLQIQIDQESRLLENEQWEQYALWWKQGRLEKIDVEILKKLKEKEPDILNLIKKHLNPEIPQSFSEKVLARENKVKKLIDDLKQNQAELQQKLKAINEKNNLISFNLKSKAKPKFWTTVAPVCLISGINPGGLSEEKQNLSCRFIKEVTDSFRYYKKNSTESTIGYNSLSNGESLSKLLDSIIKSLPQYCTQYFHKGMQALWKEFLVLDYIISSGGVKISREVVKPNVSEPKDWFQLWPQPWTQPWDPIFMLWEITGCTLDFNYWKFLGTKYVIDKIPYNDTFKIGRTVDGKNFLTQASFSFKEKLIRFIQNHPEILSEFPGLNGQGWKKEIASWNILSQRLNGLEENFILRDIRMNKTPGKKKDDTNNIGLLNYGSTPFPDKKDKFQHIRQGQFYIRRLSIVDNFGQAIDLIPTVPPNTECLFISDSLTVGNIKIIADVSKERAFQLSPRVGQALRLNCEWVKSIIEEQHNFLLINNQINPICGWVIPNYLNDSLQIYGSRGDYLGELSKANNNEYFWEINLKGSELQEISKVYPEVAKVLYSIMDNNKNNSLILSNLIDEALNFKMRYQLNTDYFAAYVGRPLALVTCKWQFELKLPPYQNQSWEKFIEQLHAMDDTQKKICSVLAETDFQIRLGNPALNGDGLIGYFKDNGKKGYTNFYSVYTPKEYSPYIVTIDGNDLALKISDEDYVNTTLLIDPFLPFHAYSDILPAISVKVPEVFVHKALKELQVYFKVGPIIKQPELEIITMLKPSLGDYTWLEPKIGVTGFNCLKIQAADPVARFYPEFNQLTEGWFNTQLEVKIDIFNKLKPGNINTLQLGAANTTNAEVISSTSPGVLNNNLKFNIRGNIIHNSGEILIELSAVTQPKVYLNQLNIEIVGLIDSDYYTQTKCQVRINNNITSELTYIQKTNGIISLLPSETKTVTINDDDEYKIVLYDIKVINTSFEIINYSIIFSEISCVDSEGSIPQECKYEKQDLIIKRFSIQNFCVTPCIVYPRDEIQLTWELCNKELLDQLNMKLEWYCDEERSQKIAKDEDFSDNNGRYSYPKLNDNAIRANERDTQVFYLTINYYDYTQTKQSIIVPPASLTIKPSIKNFKISGVEIGGTPAPGGTRFNLSFEWEIAGNVKICDLHDEQQNIIQSHAVSPYNDYSIIVHIGDIPYRSFTLKAYNSDNKPVDYRSIIWPPILKPSILSLKIDKNQIGGSTPGGMVFKFSFEWKTTEDVSYCDLYYCDLHCEEVKIQSHAVSPYNYSIIVHAGDIPYQKFILKAYDHQETETDSCFKELYNQIVANTAVRSNIPDNIENITTQPDSRTLIFSIPECQRVNENEQPTVSDKQSTPSFKKKTYQTHCCSIE